MTNSVDVMAQVQATMAEALNKVPAHTDTRSAVITICLDTAKRMAATEVTADLRELWAEKFYQAADQLAQPTDSQGGS
jgi:truncated hemoglobin YjbI